MPPRGDALARPRAGGRRSDGEVFVVDAEGRLTGVVLTTVTDVGLLRFLGLASLFAAVL